MGNEMYEGSYLWRLCAIMKRNVKKRTLDDLNKNTILLSSFIERSLFKNSIPWLMARESRTISIRVVKLARVTTCRSAVCDLLRIRDDICTEMVERMVRNGGWCKNDLDKYYEPLIFSFFFFFFVIKIFIAK